MTTLAKNVSLTRCRRTPDTSAKLIPVIKLCHRCTKERGVDTVMFHYEGTEGSGKFFSVDWCSYHQSEMNA